jgi:PAS domain S-box-containing protein
VKYGTDWMLATILSNKRARVCAIVTFLVLLLATFFVVSLPVTQKIGQLATADTDNMQWTLAQVEVEYFALKTELSLDVSQAGPDVVEVRKRFDVFYSRINTLRSSKLFTPLREGERFNAALGRVWRFLQDNLQSIDGTDRALVADRGELLVELLARREDVRQLALEGITTFAILSDERRERVSATLQNTAAIAVGLILLLAIGFVIVFQLLREGNSRARALQQTTSRLHAIVSTSLAAIVVIDKNGLIIDYNGAAETVFGYTREEAIGGDLADMIIPDHFQSAHHAGVKRYLTTGEKSVIGKGRVQLEAKRKSGEIFPVELSISTAQSDGGEIFVSFMRDISARVKTENELLEARDKAVAGEKAKAELLAVMSHEMRTPLNGLLGTLDLMSDTSLTSKQERYFKNMLTSGQLLLHHVNSVLDIAKLGSGKMSLVESRFELCALVEDLVEGQASVAENNGNTLCATVLGGEKVFVLGDPMRLRQIILNLVGNAIKFTRNGEISLEVEELHDGMFEFRVTDSGIGISETDLQRVFDDFVTLDASYGREAGGTGLGLGITKRIADALGGEIGVESELGEGSLFWVRLPMMRRVESQPRVATEAVAEPTEADARKLEVLLVEDNSINRQVASAMLSNLGHNVVEAYDGDEGVAIASTRVFDLILMDISMPRMDGVEATRLIRQQIGLNQKTRIIALTANALPEDLELFWSIGINDALIKPISRSTLRAVIDDRTTRNSQDGHISAVLDETVLQELTSLMGRPVVSKIIRDATKQTSDLLGALEGLEKGGEKEMAERVHKLAGTISLLGRSTFLTALQQVEMALRAGELKHGQLDVLQKAWPPLVRELQLQLNNEAEACDP